LRQYIVDAFADHVFEGNPAAICVLDRWPSDELMQKIAKENALKEIDSDLEKLFGGENNE